MEINALVIAAGICGGLVIVFLLVVSARVFAMRRRVSALMKENDVDGLRDMAIASESATVRAAAVEALGRFGAQDVLDPLVEALKQEEEPVVRMLILETITSFGQRAAGPLLRSWTGLTMEEKAGAVLSLKALGQEPLTEALADVAREQPELLALLADQPGEVLQRAVVEATAQLARAEDGALPQPVSESQAGEHEGFHDG